MNSARSSLIREAELVHAQHAEQASPDRSLPLPEEEKFNQRASITSRPQQPAAVCRCRRRARQTFHPACIN